MKAKLEKTSEILGVTNSRLEDSLAYKKVLTIAFEQVVELLRGRNGREAPTVASNGLIEP